MPQADWYTDPERNGLERYWDGQAWTDERRPLQPKGQSVKRSLAGKVALTTWEGVWYVLWNIYFGFGYLSKVPAKKALSDFGLVEMTGAEQFWYVIECLCFGSGYFAKIPIAKALSELPQYQDQRQGNLGTLAAPPSYRG